MRFTFALLGLPAALLRKGEAHGEAGECLKWNEKTVTENKNLSDEELAVGCVNANCDLKAEHVVADGDDEYNIECTSPLVRVTKRYHKKQHRMRH